jgi:hypothetical protein
VTALHRQWPDKGILAIIGWRIWEGVWRMLIGEKERLEGDQGAHEMRTLEKSGRRGDVFIADILPIREVEKIITQGSGWAMGWKKAVLVDDMAGWAGIGVGRDRLRKQQFVMP